MKLLFSLSLRYVTHTADVITYCVSSTEIALSRSIVSVSALITVLSLAIGPFYPGGSLIPYVSYQYN